MKDFEQHLRALEAGTPGAPAALRAWINAEGRVQFSIGEREFVSFGNQLLPLPPPPGTAQRVGVVGFETFSIMGGPTGR